jgi:hypothetical protein
MFLAERWDREEPDGPAVFRSSDLSFLIYIFFQLHSFLSLSLSPSPPLFTLPQTTPSSLSLDDPPPFLWVQTLLHFPTNPIPAPLINPFQWPAQEV